MPEVVNGVTCEYLVLCSRAPGNELVAAECEALTGGRPGPDGLAFCRTVDRVAQAAYRLIGMREIAHGATMEDLIARLVNQSFVADGFHIDVAIRSKQVSVDSRKSIRAVADAIHGTPNLNHPQHRLLIIVSDRGFSLAEILVQAEYSYKKHDKKPFRTSSSLPSQLARALVNLVYPAQTILDPCCGTGSILLEACATGVNAYGIDRNTTMVGMTQRNLQYFGYEAVIQCKDALNCSQTAEAVVTDFPYGRFLVQDENNIKAILKQMTRLATLGVYVVDKDISAWLLEAGYRHVDVFRVPKRTGMIRFIHRAEMI
jgi:tRNA G10  N-methylase Trm11